MTRTGRSTALAAVLLGAVVAELLTTVIAGARSGLPAAQLDQLLVFTNTGLGVALAVAGWPIATYRPANPVGWLLLGGGVAYASTGAGMPLLAWVAQAGWADHPFWRALATVISGGWSWAITFNPVRVWLQNHIDRVVYGARRDPVRAMAAVGSRLGETTGTGGLGGVLDALCRVMRLPSATIIVADRIVARCGDDPATMASIPLTHGDEVVGELVVGLRPGEARLAQADERVLTLLAAPIAVALHATRLADELSRSREQTITAREEERRRLRRDLHDRLGPVLTSVVLNAEAARAPASSPGVGLTSIRERATELGGRCTIQLDRTGGRIDVWLPVPARPATPAAAPAAATEAGTT